MSSSRTLVSMLEEEPSARFNASSSPDIASDVLRAAFSSVPTTAPSDNVSVLESSSHDLAWGGLHRGCITHNLALPRVGRNGLPMVDQKEACTVPRGPAGPEITRKWREGWRVEKKNVSAAI